MISYHPISRQLFFQGLRPEYYRSLTIPLDGMWESAFIGNSRHYALVYRQQTAGFFCIDANRTLLIFHVREDLLPQSQPFFDYLLSQNLFDGAYVSTGDPLFLSLCLDRNTGIAIHTLLYQHFRIVPPDPACAATTTFKPATPKELQPILAFYKDNLEVEPSFKQFVKKLISRQELYLLRSGLLLVATGECRISQSQPPNADIGMIVSKSQRNRGLGRYVLCRLKALCHRQNLTPICSTEIGNIASQKAISAAGFISRHRILTVRF